MTSNVIVDKFVQFCNRLAMWGLIGTGLMAFAIASISNPVPEVSVAGGAMFTFIAIGFDRETRESHLARFWSSYRRARG